MVSGVPHRRQQAVVAHQVDARLELLEPHAEVLVERCGEHHPQPLTLLTVLHRGVPSVGAADTAGPVLPHRGTDVTPGSRAGRRGPASSRVGGRCGALAHAYAHARRTRPRIPPGDPGSMGTSGPGDARRRGLRFSALRPFTAVPRIPRRPGERHDRSTDQRVQPPDARWPAQLRRHLRAENTGAILLLLGAVVALVWANSPWPDAYTRLGGTVVGPAALHLDLTVAQWATDGLLAIFFFVVGLELKREMVDGQLRRPRPRSSRSSPPSAAWPSPRAIYVLVNTPARRRLDGRLGDPGRDRHRVRGRRPDHLRQAAAHRAARLPAHARGRRRPARHRRHRRSSTPTGSQLALARRGPRHDRRLRGARRRRGTTAVAARPARRRRLGLHARVRHPRDDRGRRCSASPCPPSPGRRAPEHRRALRAPLAPGLRGLGRPGLRAVRRGRQPEPRARSRAPPATRPRRGSRSGSWSASRSASCSRRSCWSS